MFWHESGLQGNRRRETGDGGRKMAISDGKSTAMEDLLIGTLKNFLNIEIEL